MKSKQVQIPVHQTGEKTLIGYLKDLKGVDKNLIPRRLQLSAVFAALLLLTSPAWAEAPIDSPDIIRQSNVRRLIFFNECRGCDLIGITLTQTSLMGADLQNADLRFADLTGSNLENANLKGADLTGVNLTNAFLRNTNLAYTHLDWVNFSGAQLHEVTVTGASMANLNLTGAQLLNTPISIGGPEQPFGEGVPLEPIIPFEDTIPPLERYP